MKILIINKSDTTGGAAIAARRLKDALLANGHTVKMLVQEKLSADSSIYSTNTGKIKKFYHLFLFIIERFYFLFFEKSKDIRFAFSPAVAGENISAHPLIKEADIIHFHWFNQGFLSLKNVKQILKLNKKIVWTLHDMWAFTGGCHYSGSCNNYETTCGNCLFLKNPDAKDLSAKILKKKRKLLQNSSIQFVTCSNWLAEKAAKSSLLKDFNITPIPNPIDTNIFNLKDKAVIRKKLNLPANKKLILFGAANILDKRKGIVFLVDALLKLIGQDTELSSTTEILLFGKSTNNFIEKLPLKVNNLGIIKGELNIASAYAAADLFVLPSLEDNLPNTVMESLACGTPVVAFNTGGIPEMIEHQRNGYLAEYKSVDDLANGIQFILNANQQEFSKNAINMVSKNYSQTVVSEKYLSVYKKTKLK